ncbi:MAG: hypothetical protein WBQ46_00365 [Terriglobales bacterium]
MAAKLTMCPNTAASVNNAKAVFDVFEIGQFEIGQEIGRIWTEKAVDVKPELWQFSLVKGGVSVGEMSEYFDTKEDALAAFERKLYKPCGT